MQKLMLNTYVQSIITVTIGGIIMEGGTISMPKIIQIVEQIRAKIKIIERTWLGMNINGMKKIISNHT